MFPFRFARIRPLSLIVGSSCLILALWALILGLEKGGLPWDPWPLDKEVERMVAELKKREPDAADFYQRLTDRRETAALLRVARQTDKNSYRQSLVRDYRDGTAADRARMLRLAFNPQLSPTHEAREALIANHGQAIALLSEATSGSPTGAGHYLDQLEAGAKGSEWALLHDDPAALQIWSLLHSGTGHEKLWDFYVRNRAWLDEALAQIEPAVGANPSAVVIEALENAKRFDPLPKQVVTELGLGPFGLLLFSEYGSIIQRMVKFGAPLNECVEIVFANQGEFQPLVKMEGVALEEKVGQIARLRDAKPSVWNTARERTNVLWLEEQAPESAEDTVKKYGDHDIANLIALRYPDDARLASNALKMFGDAAYFYLERYHDHSGFRAQLRNPKLGVRVIPYLAKFGEEGFGQLDNNTKWLNEYFEADGREKKPPGEWLKAVPFVGAPLFLIEKLKDGRPVSASDVGWAVFDVADTALLIASFGTSSAATAVVETGKYGGVRIARNEALKEISLTRIGREASKEIASQPVRDILRRSVRIVGKVAKMPIQLLKVSWRGAKAGTEAWGRVPPNVRKWTYRALLGVSLFFVLEHRTLPNLPEVADKIRNFTQQVVNGAIQSAVAVIGGVVEGIIKQITPPGFERVGKFAILSILVGVLGLGGIGFLMPLFRRRLDVRPIAS